MRVVLLCATQRGRKVAERLLRIMRDAHVVLVTFREEPWEPPFFDDIRSLAAASNASFIEATRLDTPEAAVIWNEPVDLLLAIGWRHLVPSTHYSSIRLGAFVFHDSLLPKYRGFSPTVWAMANGEDHTGVTLFEMAAAVDAGDVVDQIRVPIGPDETIADVVERVTATYLQLLERNLPALVEGNAPRQRQEETAATFCARRTSHDNEINWKERTDRVYNLVRAVGRPYPGAYTTLGDRRLRIWAARPEPGASRWVGRAPGRVVEVRPGIGSIVLTRDAGLLVTEAQVEGDEPRCAAEILSSLSATLGSGRHEW